MKKREKKDGRTRRPPVNVSSGASHPFRTIRGKDGARSNEADSALGGLGASTELVQIEKPIYGGAFLARVEGKAVFVPLTLPGEQADVRIVEEKRGYATAEVDGIVIPAPERVAPACRHFGACGGCQYQHANYAAQLEFKKAILRETLERGGVQAPDEIAVLAAEPWAYRNRIRVAFDKEGRPGYRGRRSHAVVPIEECPIAAPTLVKAAFTAAELFRRFAVPSRPAELSLFCYAAEDSMLASVFTDGEARIPLTDYFGALVPQIPALRGVELVEIRQGQPKTVARTGTESISYRAAGFDYRVDHGAFFQVNRWLVDGLVERVTGGQSGKLAWDLFAGVGLFARQLAKNFARVTAVESAPAATKALGENLRGTRATAVKAATLEFLRGARQSERPDLIVADPPRTGLGAETTALLAEIGAPAVTYVSCDPATLARDLRALIGGGYAIDGVSLADLFPQTFHLETVVRLRR
ncbi:MAG: 23S rRNA (uracil(1939)-C(5))-methyltransferase RlmD [Terracidiphilus sp.]